MIYRPSYRFFSFSYDVSSDRNFGDRIRAILHMTIRFSCHSKTLYNTLIVIYPSSSGLF
jgi:hypothetical protein